MRVGNFTLVLVKMNMVRIRKAFLPAVAHRFPTVGWPHLHSLMLAVSYSASGSSLLLSKYMFKFFPKIIISWVISLFVGEVGYFNELFPASTRGRIHVQISSLGSFLYIVLLLRER